MGSKRWTGEAVGEREEEVQQEMTGQRQGSVTGEFLAAT